MFRQEPPTVTSHSALMWLASTLFKNDAITIAKNLPWPPESWSKQKEYYHRVQSAFIAQTLGCGIHQIAKQFGSPIADFGLSMDDDPHERGPLSIALESIQQTMPDGVDGHGKLSLTLSLSFRPRGRAGVENTARTKTLTTKLQVESKLRGFRDMDIGWKNAFRRARSEKRTREELVESFDQSIQAYSDATVSDREFMGRQMLHIPDGHLLHLEGSITEVPVSCETLRGAFEKLDITAYTVIVSYQVWHSQTGLEWPANPGFWEYQYDIRPHKVDGGVLESAHEMPSEDPEPPLPPVHRAPNRLKSRPSSDTWRGSRPASN